MYYRVIFILCLSIALSSCNNDEPIEDFRDNYIGTYDCKKSSRSFDDPMAVDIDVLIEKDSIDGTLLIINGMTMPVNPDGTYGPGEYDRNHYNLELVGDSIKLHTYPIVLGLAIPCYIYGKKN